MESNGLKVNLEKIKIIVCRSEGEVIQSIIDPCDIWQKGDCQFNVLYEM